LETEVIKSIPIQKKWNIPSEIPNQIDLTRTYKNIGGNAFLVPNRLLIETKR
jgi:hypothetical protein